MSHDMKKSPMLDALYESVRQKREEEERSQVTLLRAEIEDLRAQNAELLEVLTKARRDISSYMDDHPGPLDKRVLAYYDAAIAKAKGGAK